MRLLIDDSFLFGKDAILLEIAHHPNIQYRVFNPYLRRPSGIATRQALNLAEFRRLDHRMHNKAMIVDNRVAIVGGRNLADEYFGLHDRANFRDLEVIVGGPVVLDVSREFDGYWNSRWSVPIESLSAVRSSPADLDNARTARGAIAGLHVEEAAETRLERWKALARDAYAARSRLLADEPPDESPALEAEAPVQVANALTELFDTAEEEIIMLSPVSDKELALHAKALIVDRDKVFIGSANLDPRSLRINTEMGFVIESEALNETLRAAVAPDFERSNAWQLELDDDGDVAWVSDEVTLTSQPAASTWQRIEDWFFAKLPIEGEL